MIFPVEHYTDLIILSGTFGVWGWILSAKLSRPGNIFAIIRRFNIPEKLAKPLYDCAACVAGAQGSAVTLALCLFGLLPWVYFLPVVIIGIGVAHFLDQ